ncbi:ATP-binding protein [Embleya sp. AB8]|uniref:ATP-binding protein n=1 Tax=Embleya sp. AB8 TaxID=3156304 RepID=UPI003C74805B
MPEVHRTSMPACPRTGVPASGEVGHRLRRALRSSRSCRHLACAAEELVMSGSLCSVVPCPPSIPPVPSHWSFPVEPVSVGCARRAVAAALLRDCPPELADELVLVTSELVTNAVRYGFRSGGGPGARRVEVVLWTADGYYWLAVSDPGAGRPRVGLPGRTACGGRGMLLVDRVAAAWAVVARPGGGKSVVVGLGRR